jgi:hypothetical protein
MSGQFLEATNSHHIWRYALGLGRGAGVSPLRPTPPVLTQVRKAVVALSIVFWCASRKIVQLRQSCQF